MSQIGEPLRLPGMTTVLLAGASGVFGRHIDQVLTDAGYTVLGLGRGSVNAVRADINDREQLLAAVAGHRAEVVVHAATALAKPPIRQRDLDATDTLRTVGMANLVEAAGIVGARKFISENIVFGYGYGPHGSAELTEDAPWGPVQSNAHTEQHVAAMRTKEELTFSIPGVDGVSLRYGLFYGPGGTDAIIDALRKRMMPAPKNNTVLPFVHLVDAATAVRDAIEHGRAGTAYNIVDDQAMNFGAHIIATAQAFGLPKPMSVPAWLLRPMGLLTEILRTDMRVSNARARDELGWAPKFATVNEGLADLAGTTVR
jgi:nucleoside-diphosphate-sugar epimerase